MFGLKESSKVFLLLLVAALGLPSQAATISTFVGGGLGSGKAGADVAFFSIESVAVGPDGNAYFADRNGHVVYRWNPATGRIEVVAGTGVAGYDGDNLVATRSKLNQPGGLAFDKQGRLWIGDKGNWSIRRLDFTSGLLETVIGKGKGVCCWAGGSGSGLYAAIPGDLVVDGWDRLWISDLDMNAVVRYDAANGTVERMAGSGMTGNGGDGGPAVAAQLSFPAGIDVDSTGSLLIADRWNFSVRRVEASSGIITTLLSRDGDPFFIGTQPASLISVASPTSVRVSPDGSVYVTTDGSRRVLRLDMSTRLVTPVVGKVPPGSNTEGLPALETGLQSVNDLAFLEDGGLLIADGTRLRRMDGTQFNVQTVAGNGNLGAFGDGDLATAAGVGVVNKVAMDPSGNLYFTDGMKIRRVRSADGIVETVAGTAEGFEFNGDGLSPLQTNFWGPGPMLAEGGNRLLVSDVSNFRVRLIDEAGAVVSTILGTGTAGFNGDGHPARETQVAAVLGLGRLPDGSLVFADAGNNRIRKVDIATGLVFTIAGTGEFGFSGDGGPGVLAQIGSPAGLVVASDGTIFFVDTAAKRIRRLDPVTGNISTFAGNGTAEHSGDGGAAVDAGLNYPSELAVDPLGNVYVSEDQNPRIRRIDRKTGVIETIAGTGDVGFGGDGGDAKLAVFGALRGLAFSARGVLYVADMGNRRVRQISGLPGLDDNTPPVIDPRLSGTSGLADWFRGDVAVRWGVVDAESTARVLEGCGDSLVQFDTSGTSFRCAAASLGGTASAVISVKRDTVPPAANAAVVPALPVVGWRNSPVSVSFYGTDALSGVPVDGCDSPVTLSQDGADQVVAGRCRDAAGNVSEPAFVSVSMDLTKPQAYAEVLPAANSRGWNNSVTKISFLGTDSLSGSGVAKCSEGALLSADTPSFTLSGTCTDVAGNVSDVVVAGPVRIDTKAPRIVLSSPSDGAVVVQGTQSKAVYSCSDSLSGVAVCAGTVKAGASYSTEKIGPARFSVQSTDFADNQSHEDSAYFVVAPGFRSSIVPKAVDFGVFRIGSVADSRTVLIRNDGSAVLTLLGIELTGSNPKDFSVSSACGPKLQPGKSCYLTVGFRPSKAGVRSATLKIDLGSALKGNQVALSGVGR